MNKIDPEHKALVVHTGQGYERQYVIYYKGVGIMIELALLKKSDEVIEQAIRDYIGRTVK